MLSCARGRRSTLTWWWTGPGEPPVRPPGWPTAAQFPRTASTECGLLYYSRHYRVREDAPMPGYASLLGGPRGDLGYLAYAVFIGDNRTFCLCIMPPVWDRPFRQLRDEAAFQRVATLLPGMAGWLDVSEPASSVFAMGQLRNTLNTALDIDSPAVTGFVSIGDARCHTNPTFAFGASLSLWQAVRLASLAGSAADDGDLVRSFEAEVALDAAERFAAVSAEDAERARHWSGEPIDPTDPQACPALFLRHVVYRVAVGDGELLRVVARRINALDPVNRLGQRTDLLERALARYREMQPSLPPAPPRSQLLAALNT